jgi:hypothetical protein
MAALFILPLKSYAALLTRLLPERKEALDQGYPSISTPRSWARRPWR